MKVKIGNKEFHGVVGIILAILIMIPVLALVGFILSLVFSALGIVLSVTFSIAGVVLAIGLGVALIGVIISLLSLLLPKKWRKKLGVGIHINYTHNKAKKPTQTLEGNPIVDVDFKEDK